MTDLISASLSRDGDHQLLTADYARKAIPNIAYMEKFTCDRTIMQYAEHIWGTTPCAPSLQKSVAPI
jgi:glucan phosphorylase